MEICLLFAFVLIGILDHKKFHRLFYIYDLVFSIINKIKSCFNKKDSTYDMTKDDFASSDAVRSFTSTGDPYK